MLPAFAGTAGAQDFPNRPLTLVVPFAAGGGIDVIARIQAQRMGELLGQNVVVENIGAAAGMAGGARVARAAPDGYTFEIGNVGTHAYNQTLYKKPLYNAVTDFTPVGLATESPRILITRKDLPVNDLQELIAYLKANQSKMQFGSAGVGSGTHLPCVLLNLALGVNVTHVPYRGEAPAMQDLIGGRTDYMCATIQTGAAQANQGSVKAIAIMGPNRVPIIPGVATTAEQGLPGVELSVWNAFFLPKGTPDPIVRKLNKAMSDALDDPAMRKRLEELGLEIVPPEHRTPEYLAKFLPQEIERWSKPILAGRHQRGLNPNHPRSNWKIRPRQDCCDAGVRGVPLAPEREDKDNRHPLRDAQSVPTPREESLGEDHCRDGYRLFSISAGTAQAEDWPTPAITMAVPDAAGGPVDTIGRILAARLSEILGQQVVIENAGGAGGMTRAARVAKSAPDGYTVLLSGSAVLAINQTLYKKPLYNAVTDFEHVVLFSDLRARADHAQGPSGEHAARIRGLCQSATRGNAIRLRRGRRGNACVRRPARRRHGHQDYSCALPRRRAGDARFDRGPHRFHCRTPRRRCPRSEGNAVKAIAHARRSTARPALKIFATA